MRSCRIQLSGAPVTLLILVLSEALTLLPSRLSAQSCAGTLGSITYDTLVTNTVMGADGRTNYAFDYKIPGFPISALTLYAVAIQSNVTVNTDLAVQNGSVSTASGRVSYFRSEDVSSTPSGDINNGATSGPSFTISNVAGGATTSYPNKKLFNNYQILYDSNTTAATLNNYLGAGKIDFSYSSNSQPLVTGPFYVLGPSMSYSETVNFSVTYYYCNPGILATDILSFTATKQNDNTVQLGWNTSNEQAGRQYIVQVSTDGTNYTDDASIASDPVNSSASYSYTYPIDAAATGKLFFRLRIVDDVGPNHYSIVRIIDIDRGASARTGFFIYPNPPTDFINLGISGNPLSWQVDILAADGSLVQRNRFSPANTLHLNFNRKLAGGTYFVHATNAEVGQQYASSFIIR